MTSMIEVSGVAVAVHPWAAKRFKSYLMAVLIHGSEGLIIVVLVPMAIMGRLQN